MAHIDNYILRQSASLRSRIIGCAWGTAPYILAESDQTPNHENRVAWANACLVANEGSLLFEKLIKLTIAGLVLAGKGEAATDAELDTAFAASVNAAANQAY